MAAERSDVAHFAQRATFARGPRRVLMTADTVGGVWTYALELCRALAVRGHDIVLATMGAMPSRAQRREAASIPRLELHARAYRLVWMDDPWRDVDAAGDWLRTLARDVRPDVVHLNDLGHGDLDWNAPVLLVGHSCVLSWWEAVHREPAPRAWGRYYRRAAASVRAADVVVAPSATMLGALERHYGPLGATRVIANGCVPSGTPDAAKGQFVMSSGRLWDEAKNVGALAAIAPRLDWPVFVAGAATRADGTRASFDGVRGLGALDLAEARRWVARAPIYAAPARYEPFGLGILEAAAAGAALVLGDIASLREIWGDAALFVAPDDRDALADALRELIDDASLRADFASRARRRSLGYQPDAMADAYEAAYAELAIDHAIRFERGGARS